MGSRGCAVGTPDTCRHPGGDHGARVAVAPASVPARQDRDLAGLDQRLEVGEDARPPDIIQRAARIAARGTKLLLAISPIS
jgi:hypothetical protein